MLSLFLAVVGVILISGEELQHNFEGMYGIIIGLISAGLLAASMVMIKKSTRRRTHSFISINVYSEREWCFRLNYSFTNF